jgi:hypothetical protein
MSAFGSHSPPRPFAGIRAAASPTVFPLRGGPFLPSYLPSFLLTSYTRWLALSLVPSRSRPRPRPRPRSRSRSRSRPRPRPRPARSFARSVRPSLGPMPTNSYTACVFSCSGGLEFIRIPTSGQTCRPPSSPPLAILPGPYLPPFTPGFLFSARRLLPFLLRLCVR